MGHRRHDAIGPPLSPRPLTVRPATRLLALVLLAGAATPAAAQPSPLVGTWELVSRTDSSAQGVRPADGALGADPIAWISYDAHGHVQAQLMARDRMRAPNGASATPGAAPVVADPNNSAASGGYDAYFGTYAIDGATGTVTHHLVGALTPADVGRTLTRRFALEGASLVIWFEARRTDGTPVIRRLRWRRAG
jgi:hypothetical protein